MKEFLIKVIKTKTQRKIRKKRITKKKKIINNNNK